MKGEGERDKFVPVREERGEGEGGPHLHKGRGRGKIQIYVGGEDLRH